MNINTLSELIQLEDDTYSVFLNTVEAINRNDKNKLEENISNLPIKKLSAVESSRLLNLLLDVCREVRNSFNTLPLINIIFEEFETRTRSELEEIELYPSLFFDQSITIDNLKYLSEVLLDSTFGTIGMDIINIGDWGDRTLLACMKLNEVYPDQSSETLKVFIESAFNLRNDTFYYFFHQILSDSMPLADPPEWLTNEPIQYKENTLVNPTKGEVKDLIKTIISDQSSVHVIPNENLKRKLIEILLERISTNSFFNINQDLNEIRDRLYDFYTQNPDQIIERYNELNNYNLNQSEVLFRLLGPANPAPNSNNEQLKYGGYRMFKHGQWDFDQETEEYLDWFNGKCENCSLRLRSRYYSIRMPMPQGGWKGCYCSFPCLKSFVQREIECTNGEPDLIVRRMIDLVEEQIKTIKIQDRI
jgi:hypothetical protein